MAARLTGLRKHQVRYIADQGHLGAVRRVRSERRFDAAQVALLRRIGALCALGFLLAEAAALAQQESAEPGEIDLARISEIARDTATSIQRSLEGWLLLCQVIDRRLSLGSNSGSRLPPGRLA